MASLDDVYQFLRSRTQDNQRFDPQFQDLKEVVHAAIQRFEHISFSKAFGFSPFSLSDITDYLVTPSQFSLRLKRERGKGILYGVDHVRERRLMNQLPQEFRKIILVEKLKFLGLLTVVEDFLTVQFSSNPIEDINDIVDIGMGESIYLIVLKQQQSVVIKKGASLYQAPFNRLVDAIGGLGFRTKNYKNHFSAWQVATYMGPRNLNDWMMGESLKTLSDSMIKELAFHASVGDLLGRGDRHMENYVVCDERLIALDVSLVFCLDNQHWVERYVAGGMYEICCLDREPDLLILAEKLRLFFEYYFNHLKALSHQDQALDQFLAETIADPAQRQQERDRIQVDFAHVQRFKQEYQSLYIKAFFEMRRRSAYKQMLSLSCQKDSSEIFRDPLLKMYYYSDKGRLSHFYLVEDHPDLLFRVRRQSQKILGVSAVTEMIESQKKKDDFLRQTLNQIGS